jgi:hypothetical protein
VRTVFKSSRVGTVLRKALNNASRTEINVYETVDYNDANANLIQTYTSKHGQT